MAQDEKRAAGAIEGRLRAWSSRRRKLAAKQGWWLIGAAALLVGWGRLAARSLDPPGPERLDWAANVVRSLEFQLGLVVALLGVGALLRRERGQALVAGVIVTVTVVAPLAHGYLRPSDGGRGDGPTIRVMSINVLVHSEAVETTARAIRETRPDVVLVQEYGPEWERELPALLDGRWQPLAEQAREDNFGVAAYARREVAARPSSEIVELGPSGTPQVRVQLEVGGDPVVIYGVHLHPAFSPRGYRSAAEEARELVERVQGEDHPVVVAGDFNAIGGSAVDRAMQGVGLRDAWEEAGRGAGWTWPRNGFLRYLPGVRIDHVYVDDAWSVEDVHRLPSRSSDHRPLVADVRLVGEP